MEITIRMDVARKQHEIYILEFLQNKNMLMRPGLPLALILFSAPLFAASSDQLNYSVGLSYENTDNITLSPTNKISESIIHTLFTVDYKRESAVLNAHLTLSGDYADYQKNVYPDQATVSSLFGLTATLVKNRFYWIVENKLDRVQTRYNAANIPTNQENTNLFSTGPRITFVQNERNSLSAKIQYVSFYAEKTPSDYTGYVLNAIYARNVSRTFSIGLNVNYDDRSFDNTILNTNYSRTDSTVNFKKRLKLSEMEMDVGRTWVNNDIGSAIEQSIFRARYKYQLGEKTNFNFGYTRELGDFAGVFSGGNAIGSNLPIVGSALFILEQGQMTINKRFSSSSVTYGISYFSNDYEDNTLDLNTTSSELTLSTNLSTNVSLNLSSRYANTRFPGIDRRDIERLYSLGLSRQFLDRYDVRLNYQYTNRGSSDSNFAYDERRISLGGHYYFR
ncbi:MAG: hypothetical protein GC149_17460 [Gammaproteobacteria bacterium]|nr:hypothetical protein [Gammaproteobacteria bacterium]